MQIYHIYGIYWFLNFRLFCIVVKTSQIGVLNIRRYKVIIMKFALSKKAYFLVKGVTSYFPFGNKKTFNRIKLKNCQLILSSSNMRMCM